MSRIHKLSYILVALGWLTSAYLLYPYFLPESGVPGCSGCGVLANTVSAWQLGFPLAGWGLAYFTLVGALMAWGGGTARKLSLLVSGAGAGISLVLMTHLLSGSVVWCQFCAVTHAINLALVASLWLSSRSDIRVGAFAGTTGLLVLTGMILLAAGVETTLFQAELEPEQALESFESEPVRELALPEKSGSTAAATASVEISVFSCFQCPGCQAFGLTEPTLRDRFGDRVSFTYYNFPLSTTCNPALATNMHPRACEAAWAAEAARQQGMFWEYHDRLFNSDMQAREATLVAIAEDLGLDMEQWNADRESMLVRQKVNQDIQRGLELQINVTPTVFINGRKVIDPSLAVLSSLIEHELAAE